MQDINSVTLSGNLTKDAEVKAFGNSFVMNFTIASNKSKKEGDTFKDVPHFFECSYWTKGAEKLKAYLTKGTPVILQGSLEQQTWEKDGQKHSRVQVSVQNIKWYSRGNNTQGGKVPQGVQKVADAFDGDAFPEDPPF